MKKIKMVDPTPMQAGAFTAIGGASAGATTVTGALIGAGIGFGLGAFMGGVVAHRDKVARENNPDLHNSKQFGKK